MVKIISMWFLFISTLIVGQDFSIKSLQTYANIGSSQSTQAKFPLISNSGQAANSFTIEFDIEADYQPSLNIHFKFCDKNWQPYDNIFLDNPLKNTEYSLYFERLPLSIEGASYHYKGKFPNDNVTFPFSGKWIYYITASNNENEIYEEGRFIVVNSVMPIKTGFQRSRMENGISREVELGRVLNLRVDFNLPDSLYPGRLLNVEVIKNHEIYDPIIINRDRYDSDRYFEWDGDRDFTFVAKDIKPGKNYRLLDIRSINKYPAPAANAQFEGIETSRFTFPNKERDNFGGSILKDYRDDYAEYIDVKFRLRLPDYFKKDVFVVGSFTGWDLFEGYKMNGKGGLYTNTIELKRGVYDYQYVTAYFDGENFTDIDWIELEGNKWTTVSEYRIFVYYKNSDYGEYDEIIGYSKIRSGIK